MKKKDTDSSGDIEGNGKGSRRTKNKSNNTIELTISSSSIENNEKPKRIRKRTKM